MRPYILHRDRILYWERDFSKMTRYKYRFRLTKLVPKDASELMKMLSDGNSRRTQHPTDANAQSSRSHAVFMVSLTCKQGSQIVKSKLTLVDLAGSERATATTNMGKRLQEGGNINRSLLALGNVINALADPKHKARVFTISCLEILTG